MEEGFNLFLTGGLGGIRLIAEERVTGHDACLPEDGCIDETPDIDHDESWRTVATAAVGADVPLVRDKLLLQPIFTFIQPVREPKKLSREETMYRVGIGMAWRL